MNIAHLYEVAVNDLVAHDGVVHGGLGLGRRQVGLEVDADPTEAAEVVKQGRRLKVTEQGLKVGLEEKEVEINLWVLYIC